MEVAYKTQDRIAGAGEDRFEPEILAFCCEH